VVAKDGVCHLDDIVTFEVAQLDSLLATGMDAPLVDAGLELLQLTVGKRHC